MRKTLLVVLLLVITAAVLGIRVRDRCPVGANGTVAAGWAAFERGDMAAAARAFRDGQKLCPDHVGALDGAGFVALRAGTIAAAQADFQHALRVAPRDADALVGGGIAAFQASRYQESYDLFQRAHDVAPTRPEPEAYLKQMPAGLGTPPPLPPLPARDSVVSDVRAAPAGFEVRDADGAWQRLYVKGVNLGAALPGRNPSQFPDSAVYASWIQGIAGTGANAIRVYTVHAPAFYDALRAYDLAHPAAPLWLIQGVWAELPPHDDYLDAAWQHGFDAELERAVDVVHGRSNIRPVRGHASGFYRADVSRWTLAFLVGREWEPYSVAAFDTLRPDFRGWAGRYVRAADVTPMEAVLARAMDVLVQRETDLFHEQHPVAFVNWPLLDPLHHPTEATQAQELAFRRALGEKVTHVPVAFDADAAALDATHLHATDRFRAGLFASYHIYPYWPDFMAHEAEIPDPRGRSGYQRYVAALRQHAAPLPLLVAEYGIPASIGAAHIQPDGRDHGGLSEPRAAHIVAQLTREIAAAGAAGGSVFEWADEWFKKSWVAVPTTIPLDRNRLWKNAMDPEEYFGLLATDPVPPVAGATLAARLPNWHVLPPLAPAHDGLVLRAAADPAYLWLLLEHDSATAPAETYLGFDIWNPQSGALRWPGQAAGPRLGAGIEFALVARPGEVRLLAQPASNPFQVVPIPDTASGRATLPFPLHGPLLPGTFEGRLEAKLNESTVPVRDSTARYDSLRMVLNPRRFTPQGQEYPAVGYDRGVLPRGEPPDGLWSTLPGVLEVRIPWTLIDVTDPSARRILEHARARWLPGVVSDPEEGDVDALATEVVPGIRLLAATRSPAGRWAQWPAPGAGGAPYTWATWQMPDWTGRLRPAYDSLRAAFRQVPGRTLTLR